MTYLEVLYTLKFRDCGNLLHTNFRYDLAEEGGLPGPIGCDGEGMVCYADVRQATQGVVR